VTESPRYLSLEDALAVAEEISGGVRPEVRDLGLLDAAVHRPQASMFGEDAYPSLVEKAAALMHSIVCNHALVDGNKRLGLSATTTEATRAYLVCSGSSARWPLAVPRRSWLRCGTRPRRLRDV
jgi:prophage maintenance system killer protein